MYDVFKVVVKIAGVLFAILLLVFTGYNTWSLLREVTGNPLMSALGLVVFEGGMLYFWSFFQTKADGVLQMGFSFGMFIIDLLLVCGATALHLGAVDANTFGPNTAALLITVAVIANISTELFMPFLSPKTKLIIEAKRQESKIMDQAFKMLETKADNMAEDLANDMSEDMMDELTRRILAGRRRPEVIEGSAYHVDRGRQTSLDGYQRPEDRPGLVERMRERLGGSSEAEPAVNGHRHESTAPAGPEDTPDPLPQSRPLDNGRE